MTRTTRRHFVTLMGAAAAAGFALPAFAQGTSDRKFIFVILRGAMDGLSALIPDDQQTEGLRGSILPAMTDRLDLKNGFRLHPSLAALHDLYAQGEAAFIHAAATPYRQRSHFDGQDALETLDRPGTRTGWLNRALGAHGGEGLALGPAVPLALRGPAPASNWSPPVFHEASQDLMHRLAQMYGDDAVLGKTLATAMNMPDPDMDMGRTMGVRGNANQYGSILQALGKLMAQENGPNIGMASLDGWDTHANQAGALTNRFKGLDDGIGALKTAMGPTWQQTCVVFCSEFGRTAAANGSRGTDHGTGGLMILAGGAINGGRMFGDWPGMAASQLYQNRDLAPANDVSAALKGMLRDHLGMERAKLDQQVFPGSGRTMDGLVRA